MRTNENQMLETLAALANPHRLRILEVLHAEGRTYVSQLARKLGISRPLLHLHLKKLQDAGLVLSKMELSQDGKSLNYFEIVMFDIALNPASVADAARSLPLSTKYEISERDKHE
ncbi:helix-turn-helix domain-containing protein [Gluconacetobacter aggeris]|uniref:Helix-turn-helix domain-containing protein n=2 Tax=Gluconacetobacter aggeris TaxID=1286186 RepID=A0A7W4P182_9PROT|nr:helix-turn-helix domain-containing protein [Gluconacetobacter aggeris]